MRLKPVLTAEAKASAEASESGPRPREATRRAGVLGIGFTSPIELSTTSELAASVRIDPAEDARALERT